VNKQEGHFGKRFELELIYGSEYVHFSERYFTEIISNSGLMILPYFVMIPSTRAGGP